MMTAQQLKNSILQRAIEGKLVEQRVEEGTAKELLKEIKLEKEKLIKEGKIKKSKPLPSITEDEIPFEIPESWEWVRLSDIIDVRDGTHDTPKYYPSGIPLITSKNISTGQLVFDDLKYISEEDAKAINVRSNVDDGDILFAMIGSIGNPVIVRKTREFCIKNVALFKPYSKNVTFMPYWYWLFNSVQHTMKKEASGGVQSFISLKAFRQFVIPLPPLSEQHRIVAKIEEMLPLVDQYDKAYSQLTVLNEKFPQDMKKSILQYAIEGKLVEQRPEEGTAKELLKEIKLEKEKLVKEGKIKKSNPLPAITEDEIPFDIPESWEWVRLGEIASKIGAGSTPSGGKAVYLDAGIKFIRSQNVYNDGLRMAGMAFISEEINNKKQGSIVQSKDILLNITGGSIGRCALVPDDFDIANINQHILIIRNINEMCRYYLHKVLISPYIQELIMSVQVGVSREGLSAEKTKNMLIPLPPLSEQHRIVAKIEELMPLCDKLSKTT